MGEFLRLTDCSECGGTGTVECPECMGRGIIVGVGTCHVCGGSGEGYCPHCDGSGEEAVEYRGDDYYGNEKKCNLQSGVVCPECKGRGWVWDYNIQEEMDEKGVCYYCNGTGYVEGEWS